MYLHVLVIKGLLVITCAEVITADQPRQSGLKSLTACIMSAYTTLAMRSHSRLLLLHCKLGTQSQISIEELS
jgi:hypothetical protein